MLSSTARLFVLFLLLAPALPAAAAREPKTDFEITAGYRRDSLNYDIGPGPEFWRIVSAQSGPNIMSRFTWDDVNIAEIRAMARHVSALGVYSRINLSGGLVVNGDFQDSEFGADNLGQEWSRANLNTRGRVLEASYGVGYQFAPSRAAWSVSPLIGYAIRHQWFEMHSGVQTISGCAPSPPYQGGVCSPAAGPLSDVNEKYTAEWYGPWVGVDASAKAGRWTLEGGMEYHWHSRYSGKFYLGEYPLILGFEDFLSTSVHQSGRAQGRSISGGLRYELSPRWSLSARGRWERWTTGTGSNVFWLWDYFADGASTLYGVRWETLGLSLGSTFKF